MNLPPLTTEQGIAIQTKQLSKWAAVLKPEVFEELKRHVTLANAVAQNGYEVCRGEGIYMTLANSLMNK